MRDYVNLCREKDRRNDQVFSGMVPVYGVLRDRLRPSLLCRKAGNRTWCSTLGEPTLECSLELTVRSYFFEGSEAGASQTCDDGVGAGPSLCAKCKQRSGFLPYGSMTRSLEWMSTSIRRAFTLSPQGDPCLPTPGENGPPGSGAPGEKEIASGDLVSPRSWVAKILGLLRRRGGMRAVPSLLYALILAQRRRKDEPLLVQGGCKHLTVPTAP